MKERHPLIMSLATARKARGLSQRQLAGLAGVTQSQISKIESGAADPQLSTLTQLARVLELEPMLLPVSALPLLKALLRQRTLAQRVGAAAATEGLGPSKGAGDVPGPAYSLDDEDEDENGH